GEAAAVVAEEAIRLVAERDEQVEVAVVVVVDPRDLAGDAADVHASLRRDVGEVPAVAVIAIELVRRPVDEPDVQVELASAIEVAPGGGGCLDVGGEADGRSDVDEPPVILAVEAIRPAAKPDELVEVAVVVEVGPRVGLSAADGEELRLNKREPWADV